MAVKMFKELSADLWKAARNILADIFFTNFELVEKLLTKQATCVETVRKNKRDIPESFSAKMGEANTSTFGSNKHSKLAFYSPKKNKSVVFLPTMHHCKAINEKIGKPEITIFYNIMEGGVNTVGELCHSYSVQRNKETSLVLLNGQCQLDIHQCFGMLFAFKAWI